MNTFEKQAISVRETLKGSYANHPVRKHSDKKHIVVIGGGFAGLNFIRRMTADKAYHITLIDKNNYNYFTPLLYQVATGFLEPSSISYPFRKLFHNITFRMGTVSKVEPDLNLIYLVDGTRLNYDYLVFAAGTQPNFFGNESVRRNAIALKGVDDALFMRNSLIRVFEKASVEMDPAEKRKLLTIVIAGGGPTGVEVAGMLAELRKHILHKEYPEIHVDQIKLYVVDGAPNLLAAMSVRSQEAAARILANLSIQVKLNTMVTGFENDKVHLSNGEVIETKTLIWAAGVTAIVFKGIRSSSLGRGGRMMTDAFHRVKDYQNVFAIGDISIQQHESDLPGGHPQLAQPAIQHGKSLARNFSRIAKGKSPLPFKYFDRGEMAIIGRNFALVDLFKQRVHFGGILGLLSWLFIHLISLVNYNNIIKTLYTWLIAYLTCDQPLRMIFRSSTGADKNTRDLKELDEAA